MSKAKRTGPSINRGASFQAYRTPPEFLTAVCKRFDIDQWAWDLAADANAVSPNYYDEKQNSLVQDWNFSGGVGWLNPPFNDITPWVRKAYLSTRLTNRVAMLIPASVGSNWWRDWVHKKCHVVLLNGRLTFVGQTQPYPRDCALLLYGEWGLGESYDVWRWME